MQRIMNYLVYLIVRALFAFLALLPDAAALWLLSFATRLTLALFPEYKSIAHSNLQQAFPSGDIKYREKIVNEMCIFIARLLLDFYRLDKLDGNWEKENVIYDNPALRDKLLSGAGKKGVIFASGHLGSFEILALSLCLNGFPLNFIVRNFKNPFLDKWWNSRREINGNKVISRSGAYKHGLRALSAGKNLGILFDQNVTVNHAVFVDFFNRKAATTKIVAILALRTKSPVAVTSIKFDKGKYRVLLAECDFSHYYEDEKTSFDDKVRDITQDITNKYQKMIEANPGEWFWMHKRWRTRPPGEGGT
jgi:KDO2-lipid IV(A) lauroyltransferase